LEPLADVMVAASRDVDRNAWDWGPIRLAVIESFAETLRRADPGADASESRPVSWRRDTEPEAFAAGARAREAVVPRVTESEPLKFPRDRAIVEFYRERQRDLPADDRLGELGWEIFLLASARGNSSVGFEQAMDGTLRQRQIVRRDLLARGSAQRADEFRDPAPVVWLAQ
jgi:hypothetical protein